MSFNLGGCLIGYGVKKKNGTFRKVLFNKPIHNTITKHCLNNLLTFDGTNAKVTENFIGNHESLFVKSANTSTRYGVINSCALGTGTGTTSVNDNELKNRITNITAVKKTGSGWCGTYIDNTNAVIKLRISHTHIITQNFTIKEIGWYNQQWNTDNYQLSARVQLDEFISVEAGDEFYSIYEIQVGFQGVEKFTDFAGLGGGIKVNDINYNDSSSIGSHYGCFPRINSNGNGHTNLGYGNQFVQMAIVFQPYNINKLATYANATYSPFIAYYSNTNKLTPFISWNINNDQSISNIAITDSVVKDYIEDSFYRDVEFIVPQTFFSGKTIYAVSTFGTRYRFGAFDENDNFTPVPVTINSSLRVKVRQSWSTDRLSPAE